MESIEPTSRTAVINDLKRGLAADSTNGEPWFLPGRAREDLLDSAGARVAYERALELAPTNVEALAFFALHYHRSVSPAKGFKWADSALAIEPTYELARSAALVLSIEARDWRLAEQHLLALERIVQGRGRVNPLAHTARIAALKGDRPGAGRLALAAERLVDSTTLSETRVGVARPRLLGSGRHGAGVSMARRVLASGRRPFPAPSASRPGARLAPRPAISRPSVAVGRGAKGAFRPFGSTTMADLVVRLTRRLLDSIPH
jgi:hypothetical protein